jgi:hypothetical protein
VSLSGIKEVQALILVRDKGSVGPFLFRATGNLGLFSLSEIKEV